MKKLVYLIKKCSCLSNIHLIGLLLLFINQTTLAQHDPAPYCPPIYTAASLCTGTDRAFIIAAKFGGVVNGCMNPAVPSSAATEANPSGCPTNTGCASCVCNGRSSCNNSFTPPNYRGYIYFSNSTPYPPAPTVFCYTNYGPGPDMVIAPGTTTYLDVRVSYVTTGTVAVGVWIDYNQDLDFDDPGEQIFPLNFSGGGPANGNPINPGQCISGACNVSPLAGVPITIPSGIVCGETRMRIRITQYTGPASGNPFNPLVNTNPACTSLAKGETEDYQVFIDPSTPLCGAPPCCVNPPDILPPVIYPPIVSPAGNLCSAPATRNFKVRVTDLPALQSAIQKVWLVYHRANVLDSVEMLRTFSPGSSWRDDTFAVSLAPPTTNGALTAWYISAYDSANNYRRLRGGVYQDSFLTMTLGPDRSVTAGVPAILRAYSPFARGIKITEVMVNPAGSGLQTNLPAALGSIDPNEEIVEITNLGTSAYTFTSENLIYIRGTDPPLVKSLTGVGTLNSGMSILVRLTNTPSADAFPNFYLGTPTTNPLTLATQAGFLLTDGGELIYDAVAINGFTGWTGYPVPVAFDWSGTINLSATGAAGIVRLGYDTNTNNDWIITKSPYDTTALLHSLITGWENTFGPPDYYWDHPDSVALIAYPSGNPNPIDSAITIAGIIFPKFHNARMNVAGCNAYDTILINITGYVDILSPNINSVELVPGGNCGCAVASRTLRVRAEDQPAPIGNGVTNVTAHIWRPVSGYQSLPMVLDSGTIAKGRWVVNIPATTDPTEVTIISVTVSDGLNSVNSNPVKYQDKCLIMDRGAYSRFIPKGFRDSIQIKSPALDSVKFTEVVVASTSGGATLSYPSYLGTITGNEDYLEITAFGSNPVDISNWCVYVLGDGSRPVYRFPVGTIVTGTVVLRLGSGTSVPASKYYVTGGADNLLNSGSVTGFVLTRPDSVTVVDVVAINGFNAFPAIPPVSAPPAIPALDWSGNLMPGAGSAGISLVGADVNKSACWLPANDTIRQTLGSLNPFLQSYSTPDLSWSPADSLDGASGGKTDSSWMRTKLLSNLNPIKFFISLSMTGSCTIQDSVLVTPILIPDTIPPQIDSVRVSPDKALCDSSAPRTVRVYTRENIVQPAGVDSVLLYYSIGTDAPQFIPMNLIGGNVLGNAVFEGILPAVPAARQPAIVTWWVVARDSNGNRSTSPIQKIQDAALTLTTGPGLPTLPIGSSVTLTAFAPLLDTIKISEVVLDPMASGRPPVWPAYVGTVNGNERFVEITNVGRGPVNLRNFKLQVVGSSGTVLDAYVIWGIPNLPPGGTVLIKFGTGLEPDDPLNFYYRTNRIAPFTITDTLAFILYNPADRVIDAVPVNGFSVWPAGVLADFEGKDWLTGSGTVLIPAGVAGIIRGGYDSNRSGDWIATQAGINATPNSLNPQIDVLPGTGAVISWKPANNLTTTTGTEVNTLELQSTTLFYAVLDFLGCRKEKPVLVPIGSPCPIVANFFVLPPPDTSARPIELVTGEVLTLAEQSIPIAGGVRWEFIDSLGRPATGISYLPTYSDNTRLTRLSFSVPGLYSVRMRATSGICPEDDTLAVGLIRVISLPCKSKPADSLGSDIASVQVAGNAGNITVATPPFTFNAGATQSFSDFTTLSPISVMAGVLVSFEIKRATSDTALRPGVIAGFVDYDDNAVFDPITERLFTQVQLAGDTGFVGSFTIPADKPLGIHRLRIVLSENSPVFFDPCSGYNRGETEDYLIEISRGPSCRVLPIAGKLYGPRRIRKTDTVAVNTYRFYYHENATGTAVLWQLSTNGTVWTNLTTVGETLEYKFPSAGRYYLRSIAFQEGCSYVFSDTMVVVVTGNSGQFLLDPKLISIGQTDEERTDNGGFGNSLGSDSNQPSPDAYYRFIVPPCVDSVEISLCGSQFDTYLHILNSAGREIKRNDNSSICFDTTNSWIVLLARRGDFKTGDTLYFVVEGKGLAAGRYRISVSGGHSLPLQALAGEDSYLLCGQTQTLVGNAVGGLPPYRYQWIGNRETGAVYRDRLSGRYVLQVTDATGCTRYDTVLLNLAGSFRVIVPPVHYICDNQPITITPQVSGGTAPYIFKWSNFSFQPQVTISEPGEYSLTAEDAVNCSQTIYFEVRKAASPSIEMAIAERILGNRDSLAAVQKYEFIALGEANDFAWDFDAEALPTQQAIGRGPHQRYWQNEGIRLISVTASNGVCTTRVEKLIIVTGRSLVTSEPLGELVCYPNPLIDNELWVKIRLNRALPATIEIRDMTGKQLMTHPVSSAIDSQVRLDLSGLSKGVYQLSLVTIEGRLVTPIIVP
jgi:hypothetical protein